NVFFVLLYSRMADKNKLDNMKKEYTWFMEQSKQDVIILEKHLDDLHILFDKVHVSGATASCPGDISSDESSDDDVVEVQKTIDNSPFFRLTLSVPLFSDCVVLSCVIAKIYCYWCHIFAATIINIFIYHNGLLLLGRPSIELFIFAVAAVFWSLEAELMLWLPLQGANYVDRGQHYMKHISF
ncbi:hypothetical protein ACJX0J_022117, partial [Zea mays]